VNDVTFSYYGPTGSRYRSSIVADSRYSCNITVACANTPAAWYLLDPVLYNGGCQNWRELCARGVGVKSAIHHCLVIMSFYIVLLLYVPYAFTCDLKFIKCCQKQF